MTARPSLSTLRTRYPVITFFDLEKLLAHLGFLPIYEEPDLIIYSMPIEFPWRVIAEARVTQRDRDFAIYEVILTLSCVEPPLHRVGGVWRGDNVLALRNVIVRVLQELFRAVETPESFRCKACEDGWLAWDGKVPTEGGRSWARCSSCDWHGRPDGFTPYTLIR